MSVEYPTRFFMNSGSGISRFPLVAFDAALLEAGIANYNLLRISSILPSGAKQSDAVEVKEGSPLLTAYARIDSNVPGTEIATAVGVAIPNNRENVGVIMEYSGYCSADEASATVREMCIEAMKNHGIPFEKVLVTSIDAIVPESAVYTSLISAVSIW